MQPILDRWESMLRAEEELQESRNHAAESTSTSTEVKEPELMETTDSVPAPVWSQTVCGLLFS